MSRDQETARDRQIAGWLIEPAPPEPRLPPIAAHVAELEDRYRRAGNLLGTVLATLCLSANREEIRKGNREAIEKLFAMLDRWYQQAEEFR